MVIARGSEEGFDGLMSKSHQGREVTESDQGIIGSHNAWGIKAAETERRDMKLRLPSRSPFRL